MLLAINSASSETEIGLFDFGKKQDDKEVSEIFYKSWKSHNDEASRILPEITEPLKLRKLEFNDLRGVLVVSGPGSFTGLRIGVTIANTIAHINRINLFEIKTFDYHWLAIKSEKANIENSSLVVFAGKNGVYLQRKHAGEIRNIHIHDLQEELVKNGIGEVFGDLSKVQIEELGEAKFIKTTGKLTEVVDSAFKEGLKAIKVVKPEYVKAPKITVSKKNWA